jgi:hypothetical protein
MPAKRVLLLVVSIPFLGVWTQFREIPRAAATQASLADLSRFRNVQKAQSFARTAAPAATQINIKIPVTVDGGKTPELIPDRLGTTTLLGQQQRLSPHQSSKSIAGSPC